MRVQVTSPSISPIITFGYTRDAAGRVATKTETANGQTTPTS